MDGCFCLQVLCHSEPRSGAESLSKRLRPFVGAQSDIPRSCCRFGANYQAIRAKDILGEMPSQAKWRRGAMDQYERIE